MSRIKRLLTKPWVVMPLVAIIGLSGWMLYQSQSSARSAVQTTDQTVEATSGTIAQTVSAQGTVEAADTDDLSFTSSGTVTTVNVKAGQKVAAGDVLAEIDATSLQADVSDAEASLADAEAQLSDDQDADASDAQIAADEAAVSSAQDNLDAAREAVHGAKLVASFDGTVSQVNITVGEQLGSSGTSGTTTTGSQSPAGGSTSDLGSSSQTQLPGGNTNNSGNDNSDSSTTPDVEVITASSFTVQVGFDSNDIGKLAVGQPATISLSTSTGNNFGGGLFPGGGGGFPGGGAFPGVQAGADDDDGNDAGSGNGSSTVTGTSSATGTVTEVGSVADASSGVAQYQVTVAFTDDSGTDNAGETVDVRITYAEKQNAVQVPAIAVTSDNGVSTVTVTNNGINATRTVSTGLTSGNMVEITSGLEAGERVILELPNFAAGGGGGVRPVGGVGGLGGGGLN